MKLTPQSSFRQIHLHGDPLSPTPQSGSPSVLCSMPTCQVQKKTSGNIAPFNDCSDDFSATIYSSRKKRKITHVKYSCMFLLCYIIAT